MFQLIFVLACLIYSEYKASVSILLLPEPLNASEVNQDEQHGNAHAYFGCIADGADSVRIHLDALTSAYHSASASDSTEKRNGSFRNSTFPIPNFKFPIFENSDNRIIPSSFAPYSESSSSLYYPQEECRFQGW